jgi:hypothetical protein
VVLSEGADGPSCRPDGRKKAFVRFMTDVDALDIASTKLAVVQTFSRVSLLLGLVAWWNRISSGLRFCILFFGPHLGA